MKFHRSKLLNDKIPSELNKFFTEELTNYLVIKDGHIIKNHVKDNNIIIEDIEDTITNKPKIFSQNPFLTEYKSDAYQYNLEEVNSGVFIEVGKNKVIKDTLHVFYVQENNDLVNNTLIILGENSELSYFEYLINMTDSSINFVSNSIVNENAKLIYSGLSNLNNKAIVSVNRNSYVRRYGNSLYSIAEVNDGITDSNTFIELQDVYAVGTSKTVAITSNEQEMKIRQLIEHNAPDTEGYIENYGVSNNSSFLVFEGVGKINKDMKRSIARQSNRGIVLGKTSRLDANPLLLIDEFDVVASHGAAIGKMDEEQLYYLMSRGLTLKNAEKLIISGFLSPVTELLSTKELIEDFVRSVEKKTL